MDAIETITKKGLTLKLYQDEMGQDGPRDWDNLGTMVCWHSRYNLGDKNEMKTPGDFMDWWNGKNKYETEGGKGGEILSLYLYDHSGITMNTGGFNCPWDSGQVGYIYVTASQIRKEYSVKRITKTIREKARALLESEVKTFDQFITGDVYGYNIESSDGEHLDSCRGFYGFEYAKQEAIEQLNYWVKELARREVEANGYMAL